MEKLPTSFKALRYLPFLVASAFFMQMLDATILNTAIPPLPAASTAIRCSSTPW